eukprot:637101-Ditylum_brightwellii.AAC.1
MDEEVVLSHEGPGSSHSYFHLVTFYTCPHLSSCYAVRIPMIKKVTKVFESLCEEESFPIKSYILRWSKKHALREVGGCTRALEC